MFSQEFLQSSKLDQEVQALGYFMLSFINSASLEKVHISVSMYLEVLK